MLTDKVSLLLPYGVLFSHVVLGVLIIAILFKNSWGKDIVLWFGKNALLLAFLVSSAAVFGSLFYSEIIGFEPCILCWWQRVFLYPLPIIFGTALWKKRQEAFLYALPLVALAAIVALYQYYSTFLGGTSILSCTDVGGACSRVYVMAFGYITIELMSLTVSVAILLLAWAKKVSGR